MLPIDCTSVELVLPLFAPFERVYNGANGGTNTMAHWSAWSGGEYGPEASLFTSLAVLLLFVALAKAPV
jgi:hypothetical protein